MILAFKKTFLSFPCQFSATMGSYQNQQLRNGIHPWIRNSQVSLIYTTPLLLAHSITAYDPDAVGFLDLNNMATDDPNVLGTDVNGIFFFPNHLLSPSDLHWPNAMNSAYSTSSAGQLESFPTDLMLASPEWTNPLPLLPLPNAHRIPEPLDYSIGQQAKQSSSAATYFDSFGLVNTSLVADRTARDSLMTRPAWSATRTPHRRANAWSMYRAPGPTLRQLYLHKYCFGAEINLAPGYNSSSSHNSDVRPFASGMQRWSEGQAY